jgi:hypothetical protein
MYLPYELETNQVGYIRIVKGSQANAPSSRAVPKAGSQSNTTLTFLSAESNSSLVFELSKHDSEG